MPDATAPAPMPARPAQRNQNAVVLRKNYDLVYWWVVWLYAGVGWALTWTGGTTVNFGSKNLLFYPGPALGVGFVGLFLFVAIFTAIRARGAMSAILLMALALIGVGLYLTGVWDIMVVRIPDLHIHMNQAFYGAIFVVLFPAWLLTTFVFNRMHSLIFLPNKKIQMGRILGRGGAVINTTTISLKRLDDDIFVHRILGLRWLGIGTGDIQVVYVEAGHGTTYTIVNNVWRPDDVIARFARLSGGG